MGQPSQEQKDRHSAALRSYGDVTISLGEGLKRLFDAELAFVRLMCALWNYRGLPEEKRLGCPSTVFDHLAGIPDDGYDALVYVTNVSHLAYATTLLDTFLTDTTLFLFLLNPKSLGKNAQLPLQTLIESSSRSDAITRLAEKRARQIGRSGFVERIDELKKAFGLDVKIGPDEMDALKHHSSVRNTAVHDQGLYDLVLDDADRVISSQREHRDHPTPISEEDVDKAIETYRKVGFLIARAVFVKVLKEPEPDYLKMLLPSDGRTP